MRNANCKQVVVLVSGGIVLLAFMLPGIAQDRRSAQPRLVANPAAPTATGKGPLLKAKVNPKLMVAHKLPAKKFVAFTMKDLADPKTGKPPAANATLTLRTGRKVAAQKYLTALNHLEQQLNAWGYSLHDKPGRVTIGEMAINKAKLTTPAKMVRAAKPADARSQALATSPKLLQQEFAAASKTVAPAAIAGKAGIAGGGIVGVLEPVSAVKNFEDSWGDPSIFGASVKANLTLKGDQNSTGISGEARATGSVLGNSEDLLLATADLNAPRSGGMSAKIKVTTLGTDQVVLDHSEAAGWSKTDSFSRSLPDSLRVEYDFTIGPIPVNAQVGVKGNVTIPYFIGLLPGSSTGWMIPEVQSSVYAQAAVGLDLADTGVLAGVDAELTLLHNKLTVAGGVDQGVDSKGTFVKYWDTSRDDVTALAGKLIIFAEAEVLGHAIHRFDSVLWEFAGIQHTVTPFSDGATLYLQPPRLRQ
jgi:hypothetical protein